MKYGSNRHIALFMTGLLAFAGMTACTAAPKKESAPPVDINVILGARDNPKSVNAKGMVLLNKTEVTGAVIAGDNAICSGCVIGNGFKSAKDISLTRGTVRGVVSAGRNVTLLDATVQGSVLAGGSVTVKNSKVTGKITAANDTLLVTGTSEVNAILLNKPKKGASGGGSKITITGGQLGNEKGRTSVSLQKGGRAEINNYMIQATTDAQTTVSTPEMLTYENARLVYGNGPATYAEYMEKFPKAPLVMGPGWPKDGVPVGAAPEKPPVKKGAAANAPTQTVIIGKGSVVKGNIQFAAKNGKVIVEEGGTLKGQVIGGVIEKK